MRFVPDPEYKKIVDDCCKKDSDAIINNASVDHAFVLVDNLLKKAAEKHEQVKIVSNELWEPFYNELTDQIQDCFANNCKVSVIVLSDTFDKSASAFAKKIEKNGGELIIAKNKKSMELPNFLVVGGKRFRFEKNKDTKEAVACFNHEGVGHDLEEAFEEIKAKVIIPAA